MAPICKTIKVLGFRGDRSRPFVTAFQSKLDDEKTGSGTRPTMHECLLYAGHVGVSTNEGKTIYGFNPDSAGVPVWELLNRLKQGDRFPGMIRNDTAIFTAAQNHGLTLVSFDIILPNPKFQRFQRALDNERRKSQYYYGFPNGDGDCNCTTWLERLGLPLLTGRVNEFVGLPGITSNPSRRFGRCV